MWDESSSFCLSTREIRPQVVLGNTAVVSAGGAHIEPAQRIVDEFVC